MRVRAGWLRAERMILALLGGMREHASQFRAGQAELALRVLVRALVAEFAGRERAATKSEG